MNYTCTIRTNYFRVKDPKAFEKFMGCVKGTEDEVRLFKQSDTNNVPYYAFATYGSIFGYVSPDVDDECDVDGEEAFDAFTQGIQQHLADNDACIIFEAGNEGLRYVIGRATVITTKDVYDMDLEYRALEKARELLGNPSFSTVCCY